MAKKSGFILSKDLEQKTTYIVPKLTMPVSKGTKVTPVAKLSDVEKEKAGRIAMETARINAPKQQTSNIPPLLSALFTPRNPYTEEPVIKAPKAAEAVAKKFLSSATLGLTDAIPTRYARGVEEQAKLKPVTSALGSIAGYVAPGALGAKLVKPLVKKVTSKLGQQALEGAVVGTGITTAENIVPLLKGEKDIKQVGKEIGTGLILGAAADVGINQLGKLSKPLLVKIAKGQILSKAEKSIVAKQANIPVDNVDNIVEKYRTALSKGEGLKQQTIKPLLSDTVTPQQQIKPLLDITPTETQKDVISNSVELNTPKDSTSIPLPKKSIESKIPQAEKPIFDKYRKTVHNSFIKSNMDDEAKEFFNSNPETYQQVSNQETWDKAYSKVAENFDDAKNTFESKTSLETADDTAEAIAIMHKLSEQGKTGELIDFTRKMSEKATDAGRAVQAITLLQRSTPEGKFLQATNVVKNAIKQLEETDNVLFEKLKKNGKLPKLTEEDANLILDTMRKAQDLEGREKQKVIAIADQLIADKIPVTLGDKIKAFRNLSLLGNPKTIAIRNPLGNLIFSGLENVSQIPSGITDKMVSAMLKTTRQTPILPSVGTQVKGFKKGVAEAWDDILNNVDTSPTRGGAELPRNRKVFETAWLNKANNWLGDSLKMGDRPFYQAAYEQRLSELKKLQPNAKTEDLEKLADEFGLERTFQNKSGLSEALKVIKIGAPHQEGRGGLNALNIKGVGLGDVIMPYTQTPANILSKGIEYTPLNIIKLAKIASGGKQNIAKNQKSFTDAVGRMFTGSGIAALGYSLASQGLITGKEQSASSKVKALNKESGQQQYSIKIGDTWYSFDWAQPASIPLALGVDFYNAGLKQEDVASKLAKGLTSAGDTLTNQGVLQGITRMFGGQSPTTGLVDSLAQFPSQFIPTLANQTAQVTDKYKREADYSNLSTTAKTTAMKRIPVVRQQLEPSIDLYGEKALEQQGRPALEKAISVFLSPSLTSKETKDPLTKEIVRVYKSTNETGVIPKKDPPEGLTKQQETAFKIDMGKSVKPALSMMVNSSMYRNASDEKKAKLIERVIDDVYRKAKDRHKPSKK